MRWSWIAVLGALCGCATPQGRYLGGQSHSCDDVAATRSYSDANPDQLTASQKSGMYLDEAHCAADDGHPEDVEPLLQEAVKADPHRAGDADAHRAAMLAVQGKNDESVAMLKQAVTEGFTDLDDVLNDEEFEKLLALPTAERILVELASAEEPVAPRITSLANALKQNPVSLVVVDANPDYGVGTFVLWQGRVVESHYDPDVDGTSILMEEILAHQHNGEGEEDHQHEDIIWTPTGGFSRVAHEHLHEREEQHIEFEATGRFFGLKVKGFPRELVEAPDLEVVGYYLGRDSFEYQGKEGQAATLDVIRAVPFNSGTHLGTPVAHEAHPAD